MNLRNDLDQEIGKEEKSVKQYPQNDRLMTVTIDDSDDPIWRCGHSQYPIHTLMSTLTLMYGCAWTLTSPHWQSHLNHIETTHSIGTPEGRAQQRPS